MPTFIFKTYDGREYEHEKGNIDCKACWGRQAEQCQCGGIIHTEFLEEDWDNVYLEHKCDNCDDDWKIK